MDYAQYKKLKEDIEKEYQKNLEALDRIWNLSKKMSSFDIGERTILSDPSIGGNFTKAVRAVIEGLGAEFTVDEIVQGLKDVFGEKEFKRIQITNTLHRLCRKGEYHIVRKGKGRSPGLFGKKTQTLKALTA